MKRMMYFLAILSVLSFACIISTTPTPAIVTAAPPTLAMLTATEPEAATLPPMTSEPTAAQTNVTCNELKLYLDPALASGSSCQTLPEVSGPDIPPFGINPEYSELSLTGYVLSDRFFSPKIAVYPVQRFSELFPDVIPTKLAELQALIGGGPSSANGLPFLPNFNASQEFFAQYKVILFGSGNGIRYLTQYSQFFDPINNHEMFYTYQGLTADGKYWISAILPVSHPILPADGNNPPGGQSAEDFANNFPSYIGDLTTQLNSQDPGSFSPPITMLDALVTSIKIQP